MKKKILLTFIFIFSSFKPNSKKIFLLIKIGDIEKNILSSDDIKHYNNKDHYITLKSTSLEKIRKEKITTNTFLLKIGNEVIYNGYFEKAVNSAIGMKGPTILINLDSTLCIIDTFNIKIWYKGNGVDERNNKTLMNYFH